MTLQFRAWLALPLIAAAMLTLSMPALAQGGTASAASANDGSDLSASQQAHMAAGRIKFDREIAALRADKTLTNAQKQARYMAMLQAADKDLLAILTPAQRALLLKQRGIKQQFQKEAEALQANPKLTGAQKQVQLKTLALNYQNAMLATLPPATRARVEKEHQVQVARVAEANRIGEQLQKSLSKKVQGQIQQITLDARSKMQTVAADAALSRPEKAARIEALGHEAETKIDALLTPKQRSEFTRYHQLISPSAAQ